MCFIVNIFPIRLFVILVRTKNEDVKYRQWQTPRHTSEIPLTESLRLVEFTVADRSFYPSKFKGLRGEHKTLIAEIRAHRLRRRQRPAMRLKASHKYGRISLGLTTNLKSIWMLLYKKSGWVGDQWESGSRPRLPEGGRPATSAGGAVDPGPLGSAEWCVWVLAVWPSANSCCRHYPDRVSPFMITYHNLFIS